MLLGSAGRVALFRIFSFMIMLQMVVTPSMAHAFNDIQFEEVNDTHIQILMGKPNQGRLDAYHSAIDAAGASKEVQMKYALYATRNITVMKLLNVRKALKELLPVEELPEKRGKVAEFVLGKNKKAKIEAPDSVKRLYEGKILEITEDISYLKSASANSNKKELRHDLALGLVAITLQLIQYDYLLKFVRSDIWNQVWSQDAKTYQAKCVGADVSGVSDECLNSKYSEVKWDKDYYIKKYDLKKIDAELQGKRDGLIAQYHILSVEEKKIPLYKRIYEILKNDFGFPNEKTVQKINIEDGFALPTNLENAINKKIDGKFVQETIATAVDPVVETALNIALDNNTKALEKLTRPIHFKDDEAVFLYLAENEHLWDEAKNYYDYMKGHIQFDKGFIQAYSVNNADKLRKEFIDDTATKASYVLVGAAIALAIGSGAGFVGAGAGALGVSIGTYSAYGIAAKAIWDYSEADRYKGYAENFFYGSKDMSSAAEVQNAVEIEKGAFKVMMYSLVAAGAPKLVLNGITAGTKLVVRGASTLVRLHPEEWQALESLIAKSKTRLAKFGKFGANLAARLSQTVRSVKAGSYKVENVLKDVAARFKLTKDQVIKLLQESPKTKDFFKMISDKEGRSMYLNDLFSDLGITLTTEIVARRGDFFNEFEYVALNMIVTVALITILDMKALTRTGNATIKMFDPGLTAKQRWDAFYTPGKDLALTTAKVTFMTGAGIELYDHIKNPEEEEFSNRISRVFWTTALFSLWLGISSNIRSQALAKFINTKNRRVGKEILARQGITNPSEQKIIEAALASGWNKFGNSAASLGNNIFGTASTTLLAKYAIQDRTKVEIADDLEDVYVRVSPVGSSVKYLFDFL